MTQFAKVVDRQYVASNSVLYSEELARLLDAGKALLNTSLDAWDRESYARVRQREFFSEVCTTIKKYTSYSESARNHFFLKYIIVENNRKPENILAFLTL